MVPASPSSKLRRTRRVVEANWLTSDSNRIAASTMTLQPAGNESYLERALVVGAARIAQRPFELRRIYPLSRETDHAVQGGILWRRLGAVGTVLCRR